MKNAKKNPYSVPEFLESLDYQTSLLYWACLLPEEIFEHKRILQILKDCRAYPEGFVKIANYQTPCHAATISGNWRMLNILLYDIRQRKALVEAQVSQEPSHSKVSPSVGVVSPKNPYFKLYDPEFDKKLQTFLKIKALRKSR